MWNYLSQFQIYNVYRQKQLAQYDSGAEIMIATPGRINDFVESGDMKLDNVSFVVMIIWLMFAIYGMNTYMGMFFYCTEDMYVNNTKWVCEANGGEWMRWDSNFDDIGQSMLTLFIIASLEGWPDIMY